MRPVERRTWSIDRSVLNEHLPGMLGVLVLCLLPFFLPGYWLFLMTSVVITGVIASSIGLVTGTAGMISLCQFSFAGVAAWVVAYLNTNNLPVPFVLQVLIGALVAVPIGVLIGLPALRLRGVNLAVVTLSFAAVVDIVLINVNFPGVTTGKAVLRPDLISSDRSYYWCCLAVFMLVSLSVKAIMARRAGSGWLAVKHSERATAALGLNVSGTKLTAFATSAFIAGLGGGLLSGQLGVLTARNFEPVQSLVLFATAIMAGARYPAGAILTGALTWFIPELLNRIGLSQDIGSLIFGIGTIQALSKGGGVFDLVMRNRKPRITPQHAQPQSNEIGSGAVAPTTVLKTGTVLELAGLGVQYNSVIALQDLKISLLEGQVMGLIGPNGAGKSSLVDAVTGFTPYSGQVRLAGRVLNGLSVTQRARLGLRRSFQQDRTIPELSAGAYLNLSAGRVLEWVELERAMEFAGIANAALELHGLDVGTRRLLEVAGVLASNPKVVLLDEPAAGLSSSESVALGRRIAQIPARYGCAVLLIEHDMELVREACSSVTVLDFGRVIAAGSTREVLEQANVIAAYLGEDVETTVNA